jgi:P27 family predicted phage terminase small subunit
MDAPKPHLSLMRSPMPRKPVPPKHLSAKSKRWFTSVVTDWVFEDTDLKLLTLACENFDIAENARKTLLTDGRFYTDTKKIMHPHPLVKIEKDAMTLAVRIVRDLKLDVVPAKATGRPGGPGISTRR